MENENKSPEVKTQKLTSKKYNWNWIVGVIFIIVGLFSFGTSVIAGFLYLIVGLILIPPVAKFVKGKYGYSLSRKMKIFFIIFVLLISGMTQLTSDKTKPSLPEAKQPVVNQPQTFEDRIKTLAVKTGVTNITYGGIDNEKADNNRPTGSRMFTIKLNVPSYYDADSFYKNTGELTGKVFQETFTSNPTAYDVIVWYSGETTDKYGNKKNSVILSYLIDKMTFQKINWQNFDSTKLCDFLKTEGSTNIGETGCSTLAKIK